MGAPGSVERRAVTVWRPRGPFRRHRHRRGLTVCDVVADLRAARSIADDTYDCFILTQTLHLIDDMPAAVATRAGS